MRAPHTIERLAADDSCMFGDPYQTPDGATVIPVSRTRTKRDGGTVARPLGVFVVDGGRPTWCPVVDATPIALFGEFIGLVAATLATAAVLRRPPWPSHDGAWSRGG